MPFGVVILVWSWIPLSFGLKSRLEWSSSLGWKNGRHPSCPRYLFVERKVGDVDRAGASEDAVRVPGDGAVAHDDGESVPGLHVHVRPAET